MFTQVEEADKTRLAAAGKTKQYRWRSRQLAICASALYRSLRQPPKQKLRPGPALLLQRLVKLYLACRRNRCTLAAPSTTCLPPCSIHLPPLPVSPCFVFTALRRFSHIPGWGSHGRALHSQSGGLPGSSTRSSTQPWLPPRVPPPPPRSRLPACSGLLPPAPAPVPS